MANVRGLPQTGSILISAARKWVACAEFNKTKLKIKTKKYLMFDVTLSLFLSEDVIN